MKHLIQIIAFLMIAAGFIVGCDKKEDLVFYNNGTASTLSLSSSAVTPAPADSDNVALTVNWTSPNYATDSATTKYVIQVDSAGRNFSKAVSKTVSGALSTTFTAKDLNNIALGYGFAFNTAYSMDVRVISSYANNNEQLNSNAVTFQYTPYKIPPKVELPPSGRLFITGDATQGNWTNSPPIPAQEFYRVDETTWAGVFNLNAGGGYIILRQYGNWNEKYAVQDGSVSGLNTGGDFGYHIENTKIFDANIPGPSAAGLYVITLNFQSGKFTVVPYAGSSLPDNLYITGDATASSWTNTPPDDQKLTRLNCIEYQDTVSFISGKYYKFLSTPGQWQPQFGGSDATGGELGANYGGGNDPSAIPTPAAAGDYKIDVNFLTNTYTVTKL